MWQLLDKDMEKVGVKSNTVNGRTLGSRDCQTDSFKSCIYPTRKIEEQEPAPMASRLGEQAYNCFRDEDTWNN